MTQVPPAAASRRRRRGLTLMELVVVMTVLAALAAILIPLLPNLLRRAHKVTDATQSQELAKSVQLYQALYISYPEEWDLMTDGTTTTAPAFVPADDDSPFGGGAYIGTLNAEEVAALRRVGIERVHAFGDGTAADFHPTKNPYAAAVTAPTTLTADTTEVFVIDGTGSTLGALPVEIQNTILRDPTARFVLFGCGSRCTAVGKVIQNAPTSVPQNKEFTPSTLYARTGVIFQVAGVGIDNTTERARFIGAVALEDDELESTETDLIGYYDVANSGE
ncbi:MAG: prepilin-type N-terminal cleavage/methylation domain-containing protein [Planctomycetales bacterium]|nr:prepilin-type N-terminal cleavage/methylation domain-containing protein [Planctomycetales bacterium]